MIKNITLIGLCSLLSGCGITGWSPEQIKALQGDGACVGVVGMVNQPVYGTGGGGVIRLNSPGSISVAKDGTMNCIINPPPPEPPR